MGELIDEIQSLKRLARSQSEQGQYEDAAKTLREGLDRLEAARAGRESPGEVARPGPDGAGQEAAAQLADLYGMLGGAERKRGDLLRAAAAYDRGFRYESDPRYGIVNTYNSLNRLVSRVLMRPDSLSNPEALRGVGGLEFVDVPEALGELRTVLRRQVDGVRANDFWAAGDLAFTCALHGDVPGALDALRRFRSCSPPPPAGVYAAYIQWVSAVAELDTPRKEALGELRSWLEEGMKTAPA